MDLTTETVVSVGSRLGVIVNEGNRETLTIDWYEFVNRGTYTLGE